MCGIAGLINIPVTQKTIDNMLATMRRRGPDAQGIYIEENVCLMHRRLAVVDLQNGSQPMHLTYGAETYTIVYNGELYNTDDIRKDLICLGHTFTGHSDTEVLLHAYAQWSTECLDKLNGIYAFAVWEHQARRLILARDRMGVKPLFYGIKKNGIIFASEIKTIMKHPEFPPQVDVQGIMEILLMGPGRTSGNGVFRNIEELKPGHFAIFNRDFKIKQYWKLTDNEHTETLEETADHVRYLVTDSIKRQMVSDVPIGTFLSGGLDSSIITAVCAEEFSKTGKQLPTFSVEYENNSKYFVPGKFQPNSDESYIKLMSSYLKTNQSNVILDPKTLTDNLHTATLARDLPGMADVDSSLLAFCKEIRKNVTVALSGECADEIFGGYPWYRDPEIRAKAGFPWSQNTEYRLSFLRNGIIDPKTAKDYVQGRYESTINACDILPGIDPEERRMKEMVNLNIKWFMQTLLDRKDRMSMYNSLEVRVPFCDHRITEYMYGVPWAYKEYKGREKGLLRYAMRDYLPDDILYRKKSPYPKTHDPQYFELVKQMLVDIIKDRTAPIHLIIKTEALINLLTADTVWPWYGQLMKTPQTIAYMLQINDWLKTYKIELLF